ncbi:maleylacetoacetate isomerase [Sphingomonas sp. XMGL2]|uniref:Maleylacetoacetate isomerase n=1 Tax=Sphingomonas quercus TaxID=2842451 RepID=A0ABS6BF79_9SPHN|nr:maleylacetoacetate isomerase [Sphingomonas quercus]
MDTSPLRLHDYWRSSASFRVRIALNLKGVPYQSVPVDLLSGAQRRPAYRGINPQGLVPALEVAGATIGQSLAIIDWLDHAYPQPPLLPADPLERARAMSSALLIACDIHPINNLRVLRWLKDDLRVGEAERLRWVAHWIDAGLAVLESQTGGGPFLAGDLPGLPDICLVPQLYNARRWDVCLDFYPALLAIEARCLAIPAFAEAHPDRLPDAAIL